MQTVEVPGPSFVEEAMRVCRRWMASGAIVAASFAARTDLMAQAAVAPARSAAEGEIGPERVRLARELLALIAFEETALAGATASIDDGIRKSPEMAPFREALTSWMREIFASEAARERFAAIYAGRFSAEDLEALIDFYQTPMGRRLAAAGPGLATEGAEAGRPLAEENGAALQELLAERAAELEAEESLRSQE